MNNAQRVLAAVYVPLTIFIVIADNCFTGYNLVQYVKYVTIVTLYLAARWVNKIGTEQYLMSLALFCVTVADLFLVFLPAITGFDYTVIGTAGFAAAYLCLIAANCKNCRIGAGEVISAVLVGGITLAVLASLPLLEMPAWKTAGVVCFAAILACMTWTSICTIFRKYYCIKVACLLAISGMLMFISDLAVAYVHFNLQYTAMYQPWMQNVVWAAYIPAWTLVAVVVCEENPYRKPCLQVFQEK